MRASLLTNLSRYDETVSVVQNALKTFPTSTLLKNILSRALIYKHDYHAAIDQLLFVASNEQMTPGVAGALSNVYSLLNDVENTSKYIKITLKRLEDAPAKTKSFKFFTSFKLLDDEIVKNNKLPDEGYLFSLAENEYNSGNCEGAFPYLHSVLFRNIDNANVNYMLGTCYKMIDDIQTSATYLYRYLYLAPDGPHAVEVRKTLEAFEKD